MAPPESHFWKNFLEVIEAPQLFDDRADPQATRAAVAARVLTRTATEWPQCFDGADACVRVVSSLLEAVQSPHFRARGVFSRSLRKEEGEPIPALPLPLDPGLRRPDQPSWPLP